MTPKGGRQFCEMSRVFGITSYLYFFCSHEVCLRKLKIVLTVREEHSKLKCFNVKETLTVELHLSDWLWTHKLRHTYACSNACTLLHVHSYTFYTLIRKLTQKKNFLHWKRASGFNSLQNWVNVVRRWHSW